jgi:membrane fusion protein (multidrug efflux system)
MLKKVRIPFFILAVAAALIVTITGRYGSWNADRSEQTTDDAYIRTDLTPLSTRVSGTVKSVNVEDYAQVQPGQILVELNDEDYRANVAQAQAALAASEAAVTANEDAKQVQIEQIRSAESQVVAAEAALRSADAGVAVVKPEVEHAGNERRRQESLLAAHASTRQHVESVVADAERSEALYASREADRARAVATVENAKIGVAAQRRLLTSLSTKDRIVRADIAAKKAAVTVAEVSLAYTKISAPIAGAVGERRVHPGQLVGVGMEVLSLVQGTTWVQANYKETQVAHMHSGEVAEIKMDAQPGVLLHGRVAQIAPASGSQFALLPSDNATGNFTKVTQRIPVKITLDADQDLSSLRPGFSAVVTVKVN